MIATPRLTDDALVPAVAHMVGWSRAFVHPVEASLHEIRSLDDERADRPV